MKVLVIGGTGFFGIHMVNELLAKGHDVTIATILQQPPVIETDCHAGK